MYYFIRKKKQLYLAFIYIHKVNKTFLKVHCFLFLTSLKLSYTHYYFKKLITIAFTCFSHKCGSAILHLNDFLHLI